MVFIDKLADQAAFSPLSPLYNARYTYVMAQNTSFLKRMDGSAQVHDGSCTPRHEKASFLKLAAKIRANRFPFSAGRGWQSKHPLLTDEVTKF